MNTPAPQRINQSALDALRAGTSLVQLVARRVKLRRAGRGWSGLCPFHQERTASFTVSDEKGFFHCFGCGANGDVFQWLIEAEGLTFLDAVRTLNAGELPDARRPMAAVQRPALEQRCEVVGSSTAGRWIFATSGPARGELVERWLEVRGLDRRAEFLPGFPAIDGLRFHPRCPASAWRVDADPHDARLTAPAMVAPIADADGAIWGVHVTYLAPDGRTKARFPLVQGRERPTRKMFGRVGRNAVFLTPPEAMCSDAPLIVGEGIETSWSFAQAYGAPCRVAATLSLENLQGGAVRLSNGALPLWKPDSDPERRPFTLPDAGKVIVLVDADMKPLRQQKLQRARRAPTEIGDISGLERTELCAALAGQAWRRAGASQVTAVRPRMGWDFNDAARAA